MRVKFESVVDGINRYIDKEIYTNLYVKRGYYEDLQRTCGGGTVRIRQN